MNEFVLKAHSGETITHFCTEVQRRYGITVTTTEGPKHVNVRCLYSWWALVTAFSADEMKRVFQIIDKMAVIGATPISYQETVPMGVFDTKRKQSPDQHGFVWPEA